MSAPSPGLCAHAWPQQAQIGFGEVRHARLRPVAHAFAYPTFFLLLPMRQLHRDGCAGLAHNRRGLLSFHDQDHGDGRPNAVEWLDALLHSQGIDDADGEAWLHAYPRVWGYAFKPVSFWYCTRKDGQLRAIVVEVNNTFGERHCYLLDAPRWGAESTAAKVFHVSPFCRVEGRYRFRFLMAGERSRTVVRIDHDDAQGPLLCTSVSGHLKPLCRRSVWRALLRQPTLTLGIWLRIHTQALRLWSRRLPLVSKPAAPKHFVSR